MNIKKEKKSLLNNLTKKTNKNSIFLIKIFNI